MGASSEKHAGTGQIPQFPGAKVVNFSETAATYPQKFALYWFFVANFASEIYFNRYGRKNRPTMERTACGRFRQRLVRTARRPRTCGIQCSWACVSSGWRDIRRLRCLPLCRRESGHNRTRPLPWAGTGQRVMLFGASGSGDASFARQHIQGDTGRDRLTSPSRRRFVQMGPAGRASAQFIPDGQGASAQIAQRTGLGTAHRHGRPQAGGGKRGHSFYALGIGCHQERGVHRPGTPSCADLPSPVAAIGTQGFLRQRTFQCRQRIPHSPRKRTDKMVVYHEQRRTTEES